MTQYKQITIEILPKCLGFKVFEIELYGDLKLFQVLNSLVEQHQYFFKTKFHLIIDNGKQFKPICKTQIRTIKFQTKIMCVFRKTLQQFLKKNYLCLLLYKFRNETYIIYLKIWPNELNTLEGPIEMNGSTTVYEILDFLLQNIEITNKDTSTWTVSTQQQPNISFNQNLYEIFYINTTSTFLIVTSQHPPLQQEPQPPNIEIQPEPQTQFLPQTQWMVGQQKIKLTIQLIDGPKKIDYKLDVRPQYNFYDVKKRFLKLLNISEEEAAPDFYLFGQLITNHEDTLNKLGINKNTIIQVKLRY